MKNHVFRPLWVVLGMVALILTARLIYVPKDFGVHEKGYMYSWNREGNIAEWQAVKVKFAGNSEFCKDCHADKYESLMKTPHAIIICEDCHGPAMDHPSDPPKLAIEKSRAHCLRCHFPLPYPTSARANIRGIDPEKHNPGTECVSCHNPHNPMEGLK